MMMLKKVVIPGLTRNLGSCENIEFTGFRIRHAGLDPVSE